MLTTEQLQEFDRSGFLVVDDVFDHEQIMQPVRQEYANLMHGLCEQWVASGDLPTMPTGNFADCVRDVYQAGLDYFQPLDISLPPGDIQHDTPFHAGPAIFNLMTSGRLLDMVESLIGPEITSNPIQHVRIKPPAFELDSDEIRAHITHTDWHQDRAVTLEEADRTRMVTVWVAVTDATVENGCLQVIPKSHKGEMLTHCPRGQLAIPESLFRRQDAQPLPVKAGGAVLFHPLTVHGSLTNQTDSIRWSFDLRFNVTGDPTGRPMFPEFVARSAANPATELRDAKAWHQMWLDTRACLADEAEVEIHRWDGSAVTCA